jgi:hypothetical protein
MTASVSLLVTAGPSAAAVTAVRGSAYGFFANISLFGGPFNTRGPTPSVTLASDASNSPQTANVASGLVQYGPAIIFSTGPIGVSTTGSLGAGGTVTSSTTITSVNTSTQEVFTASSASSTCSASESGVSGSTTINGGVLQTSEGNPNIDGDETFVNVPVSPAPNTAYTGTIETVGDTFRYIFNEQVINPDGSITVYAGHLRLLGPTAVGDLYWGKAECGVTPPPRNPVSDFDGNNTTDVAVFRPANGTWFLRTTSPTAVTWGQSGDVPVPGDYNGDGTTDIAVFRPSTGAWYLRTPTPQFVLWGETGDIPVPGDYDGNGTTDVAIFRPATGTWYLRTGSPTAVFWGQNGDVPAPGDYDGNGTTDIAVFRPANNGWYIRTPAPQFVLWGESGDKALTLPDAIQRFF